MRTSKELEYWRPWTGPTPPGRERRVITKLFPKVTLDAQKTVAVIVGPPIMYRFAILEAQVKGFPTTRSSSPWSGG